MGHRKTVAVGSLPQGQCLANVVTGVCWCGCVGLEQVMQA